MLCISQVCKLATCAFCLYAGSTIACVFVGLQSRKGKGAAGLNIESCGILDCFQIVVRKRRRFQYDKTNTQNSQRGSKEDPRGIKYRYDKTDGRQHCFVQLRYSTKLPDLQCLILPLANMTINCLY